jgi:hypothetical protein
MSSKDKLLLRILKYPSDFTYDEVRSLLNKLGYIEYTKGKTSGSRVSFYQPERGYIISLHKPHPSNTIKLYALRKLVNALKRNGEI